MGKFSKTSFELVKSSGTLQPVLIFGPNLHTNLNNQHLNGIHKKLEIPKALTKETGSCVLNGTKFWNVNTEKFSRNLPKSGITSAKPIIAFLKSCHTSNEIDDSVIDRNYVCVIGLKVDMVPLANTMARAFPKYSTRTGKNVAKPRNIKINFISTDDDNKCDKSTLMNLIDNIRECARLVDTPTNILNAPMFEKEALNAVKDLKNVEVEVFQCDYLKENGFGGLYNVGLGSPLGHQARLVILKSIKNKSKKNIALVGKGIVYDSGGLSIKTKTGMPGMKGDMGGAAGLLYAFKQLVQENFNQNLYCLLCIAENSVGSYSYRPDDIIQMYSGLSVEINNTDAEGRVVLADGVAYACKDLKADIILDMCTLTGAQLVTTGKLHASVLSNSKKFDDKLVNAGLKSGDLCFPVVYMPELLIEEFSSTCADIKNSVASRENAQVSCAGHFIEASVINCNYEHDWIHVDMCGPSRNNPFEVGRSTGFGVALISCLFGEYTDNDVFNQ